MSPPERKSPRRRPPPPQRDSLVTEVMKFLRQFVVMSDAQTLVTALYVAHTHLFEVCEQTPYLSITSPLPKCGKSRLMEVLDLVVARPWMIVSPSDAVLFRQVDAVCPTLLWDEIDTVFAPKAAQYHEDQRALLDQGHRRYGKVPRFIGKVVEFSVFCPKVLAGIGALPDTIASRSIPIRLQRRKSDEPIARFFRRDVKPEGDELYERLSDWADEFAGKIEAARPDMPRELDDRMQEGCESLVAIADVMGCGQEARAALVELLSAERVDSHETMRVKLLRDVKAVCEARKIEVAITTADLLRGLHGLPESAWGSARYYGRDLNDKDLADNLSHFGVRPRLIKRRWSKGVEPSAQRGYRLSDCLTRQGQHIVGLRAAWERYAD